MGMGAASQNFNPRSPWGERLPPWILVMSPRYFNPRSPWGERPAILTASSRTAAFQSTLPVGGATPEWVDVCPVWVISIHAPRGGSDTQCVV